MNKFCCIAVRPTVSPGRSSRMYFISIAYLDHPVWRRHPEKAKRGPLSGHRISRIEGAMMSWLLHIVTTRWPHHWGVCDRCNPSGSAADAGQDAAAWVRGSARAAVDGGVDVPQALPRSPGAPPITAQRVARFGHSRARNCLPPQKLHERYSRFNYDPLGRLRPGATRRAKPFLGLAGTFSCGRSEKLAVVFLLLPDQ